MRGKSRAHAALAALAFLALSAPALGAGSERYTATAQVGAFAPNAGGQEAYTMRLSTNRWEAGVFSNQYLLAGDHPLTGAFYDWRFPICDDSCFWQFFVQAGGGVSTGGPIAQATWGTVIPLLPIWLPRRAPSYVPALRLDMTTQMIFIRYRGVTWSYPLWVGISIPF
jgi:hypothetical protein